MTYLLARTQWVPKPVEEVFDFFSYPANLQALTPPWLDFRITEAPDELKSGSLIRYKLRVHGIPIGWTTEITDWNPPHSFVDLQISGPYKLWHHTHSFFSDRGGTTIGDNVRYALPFGPLGDVVHWAMVRRDVEKIFEYRREKMREMFGG